VTKGRANIWATRKGKGVTLSTHLDTVLPYIAPREDNGRLYGRGSSDAKGIAAAMLAAAERLAKAGENRVDLLFVVGEEAGSDGARAANRLSPTSKFLVNGEPTESKLASGAKGSQRVILRFRGRAAHSAYPELGKSAIAPMLELLPTIGKLDLPSDDDLGATTVNIGTIRAGTAGNIIPELAEVELMFRLVGDVKPLKKSVERWVGTAAEIEYGSYIPAQKFETLPGFDVGPVAYTSDIPLLTKWGKPLLFGPGSIHVAHTPDEFIAIDELRSAVGTYEKIVRSLLTS
jgi:acetylornithine deacetylase